MSDQVLIEGNHCRPGSLRVRIDPFAGGVGTQTLTNLGPAILEHSASADGSTPTTVAVGATSGTLTTVKYLRSQGQSKVVTDGRFDLYVASA